MRIDSREIRLGKWNIPRNTEAGFLNEGAVYHALGYFDMIGIEKIVEKEEKNSENHPLVCAYDHSSRLNKNFPDNFFVQEIKAFTNISDDPEFGFSDIQIEEFWKNDSLILCFSMLQLYLDANVDSILEKIREVFSGVNYLYYFTLDYSGIILLAKDISVKDYNELMFKINYNNKEGKKQVKDTFSIYGLQKEKRQNIFDKFSNLEWDKRSIEEYLNEEENYEIAVNISVQNFLAYDSFRKDLDKFEKKYEYKSEAFKLSGRHDISIVNRDADMVWLLFVQFLLDQYAQESIGDFYAYESFVKVKLQESYPDQKSAFEGYKCLIKRIEDTRDAFEQNARTCGYDSYCIPVKEVCASIISILDNGFAEDFVICVYQPFIEFLEYLDKKMTEQINDERGIGVQYSEEFDKCFCAYFDGLNALVNSAMHTDRQFIRATSFSDIFYDVPPKIMAVYVAIIYKIREIMQVDGENKYTFFMAPSFSDEVSVKIISYKEREMPCDRILKVSINERSLYNPAAVVRRMTHEIAHFVGDEIRQRPMRMEKIITSMVHIILLQILHEDFKYGESLVCLRDNVIKNIINDCGIDCKKDNYSYDLSRLYKRIIDYMITAEMTVHEEIRKYIFSETDDMLRDGRYNYFSEVIRRDKNRHGGVVIDELRRELNLTKIQKEYLSKLILQDVITEMTRLAGISNEESVVSTAGNTIMRSKEPLKKYARALISLYSETYSDLQMILLLGISYEEYLKGFVNDEKLDVYAVVGNNEDISRIAVISLLMQENGKWKKEVDLNAEENIVILHENVITFQRDMKEKNSPYRYQNQNLKEYLNVCMEMSKEQYKKKKFELEELRGVIRVLVEYNDAKQVYSTICSVISKYYKKISNSPKVFPEPSDIIIK